MKLNKIKAVIFDLDGTLVNTDDLIIECYRYLFKKFLPNYKLTREEEISFLGPPLKEIFGKYFKEDFSTLLKVYSDYQVEHTLEIAYLYPHTKEFLTHLKNKGYKLYLVTSRFSKSAFTMLNSFSLTEYFDEVVGLENVSEPKPSPEGILKLLDKYNLAKEEVVFIGDTKTDYEAGRNAGVITGLVSWSLQQNTKLLKPDLWVNNYQDLERLFR